MPKTVFQKKILHWYALHGRHDLPWRPSRTPRAKNNKPNPYHILVSEYMLQQTQVARVREKYPIFLKKFPTIKKLANAGQRDVLQVWSGLGYNRRALNLHKAAKIIFREYRGKVPRSRELLKRLPGIGPYTAGAIGVFAWNDPAVCIETNIRRVYIDEFFPHADSVSDHELMPYIERTLDMTNPRIWYYALMDYGAGALKQKLNPNKKSRHYMRQSRFEGSRRYLRALIVRELLAHQKALSTRILTEKIEQDTHAKKRKSETKEILAELAREGFIHEAKNGWRLQS